MTNPTLTTITKGSWVKVATNVTCISAWIMKPRATYGWTYRDTAGAAPTLMTESAKLPYPGRSFSSGTAFDLYIWCEGADGALRLDEDFQAEYLIDA